VALADAQINKVTDTVNDKLVTVRQWANRAQTAAETAINSVGTFQVPTIDIAATAAPTLAAPVNPSLSTPPLPSVFSSPVSVGFSESGQVTLVEPNEIPEPVYGTPELPADRPSLTAPTAPLEYPTAEIPQLPAAPVLGSPQAPDLQRPDEPLFVSMALGAFELPEISAYEEVPPDAAETLASLEAELNKLNDLANVSTTAFKQTIETDVIATQIDAGLVDQYNAATKLAVTPGNKVGYLADLAENTRTFEIDKIDKEASRKVDELFSNWAARNFSIAPGMLMDSVLDVQETVAEKVREVNSQVSLEISQKRQALVEMHYKWFRTICDLAFELHMKLVRREVWKEKLRVELAMEQYNTTLSLFKAALGTNLTLVEAWEVQSRATLETGQAVPRELEGLLATTSEGQARLQMFSADSQLQEAKVDVYRSQTQLATAPLEVYKAKMGGLRSQSEVVLSNIQAYGAAVKAYAASVDAASAELDAFAAQAQAVTSGASVAETNTRAYGEYIQQSSRRYEAYRTFMSAQSDVLRANLSSFQAATQTNETFMRAQAAKVSAQAEITLARVSAFTNSIQAYGSYNRALSQYSAASLNHAMTAAENATRVQALAAQAQAETDRVNAGAISAKAQALAGLAQGAMSAMYVSASSQAAGSTSTGASYSYGVSSNWGGNADYSETRRQTLSA
jgi:hypothetical protein